LDEAPRLAAHEGRRLRLGARKRPSRESDLGDILPDEMQWMFQRMWRDVTVQIAANPQAEFAYFPIMAGDDLDGIAALLVACF